MIGKLAHLFYLGRAISRGPKALVKYETRRAFRKAAYKASRGWL